MNCENARLYYYDYLEQVDTVPQEARAHLEQCSVCRQELECLREILKKQQPAPKPVNPKYLQLHYELFNRWTSCDVIKPLLPSLLLSGFDLKQQTPVTAHIEKCPQCQKSLKSISSLALSDSQLLKASCYFAGETASVSELDAKAQETLGDVKDKTGSNILTRLRVISDNPEQGWVSDSFVVDVEYRHAKLSSRHSTVRRRAVPALLTSGIAAAILFAILLVVPPAPVKGLDLEQIYANLETVKNVHIQILDESKELRSIWIAEDLQFRLFQQKGSTVFWDERSGKIFRKEEGSIQLISQGQQTKLEHPWGLLPFTHISQLPASRDWRHVSDEVLEGGLEVQVYEYTWKETLGSQTVVQRKWRGYLDIHTHLPYKIEWLDKIGGLPYEHVMTMKVTYPSDAEYLEVIQSEGFQELSYGDQHKLFETFPSESNLAVIEGDFFLSTWPSAKATLTFSGP